MQINHLQQPFVHLIHLIGTTQVRRRSQGGNMQTHGFLLRREPNRLIRLCDHLVLLVLRFARLALESLGARRHVGVNVMKNWTFEKIARNGSVVGTVIQYCGSPHDTTLIRLSSIFRLSSNNGSSKDTVSEEK